MCLAPLGGANRLRYLDYGAIGAEPQPGLSFWEQSRSPEKYHCPPVINVNEDELSRFVEYADSLEQS